MRWSNPSGKFKVEGGKGGKLTITTPTGSYAVDWEMLVGDVHMALYSQSLVATAGAPLTDAEFKASVQDLSRESGMKIVLFWRDGRSELIAPV
jgi:hypothetical protein